MRNTISKAMMTGLTALSLAAAVVAVPQPAVAAAWHGGGRGGWHGGGWYGGGGWWGPAIIGGLAAGALAAPYYYGYGYGYGGCYRYTPVYDAYGRYAGTRLVNVCS